jgi:hypothetical protein
MTGVVEWRVLIQSVGDVCRWCGVLLVYSCYKNITMKMAGIPVETRR